MISYVSDIFFVETNHPMNPMGPALQAGPSDIASDGYPMAIRSSSDGRPIFIRSDEHRMKSERGVSAKTLVS